MISQGLPIYVALEPVDMRLGYERLGGLVRERMQAEPRSKALFVFVGKRGQTGDEFLPRVVELASSGETAARFFPDQPCR